MAMDVIGKCPSSSEGEYFRANIWSWPAILGLTHELCGDIVDEETLTLMGANDGAGPHSKGVCKKMARRFEKWLANHKEEKVTSSRRTIASEIAESWAEALGFSKELSTNKEQLKEWVAFLKSCGGFEVW